MDSFGLYSAVTFPFICLHKQTTGNLCICDAALLIQANNRR